MKQTPQTTYHIERMGGPLDGTTATVTVPPIAAPSIDASAAQFRSGRYELECWPKRWGWVYQWRPQ